MDVARAVLNGLEENEIDETNDGRGVGFRLHIDMGGFVARESQEFAGLAQLLEDFLHAGGVGAVMALDPFLDLLGGRDDDVNVLPQGEAQIFRRAQIEWIDQRDRDLILVLSERQARDAGAPGRSG